MLLTTVCRTDRPVRSFAGGRRHCRTSGGRWSALDMPLVNTSPHSDLLLFGSADDLRAREMRRCIISLRPARLFCVYTLQPPPTGRSFSFLALSSFISSLLCHRLIRGGILTQTVITDPLCRYTHTVWQDCKSIRVVWKCWWAECSLASAHVGPRSERAL